jgi:hypothetical protein
MSKKGQLESIIYFVVFILLILTLIIYYFQFKTGTVPVFRPKKNIEPASKGVLPPGTFFQNEFEQEKNNKQKLPYLIITPSYAKENKKYINNKNLETHLINPQQKITILEDNTFDLIVNGENKKNPLDKIYFQYQIKPLDSHWQNLYSKTKKIVLPKGNNLYTLYVRSVNKNLEVDPTPAKVYIYTKISNYFKDISIEINSQRNLLILKNNSQKEINVSQWRIISSKVNFLIPQAVKDVNPHLEKRWEDIILSKNNRLIIYPLYATTADFLPKNFKYPYPLQSPLGFNFRVNKCFRYLMNNFPDLKQYIRYYNFPCDKLSKNEILNLRLNFKISNNCAKVLENLSCSGPKPEDWLKINYDSNCYRIFENRFTYNGCYQNKKNDKDFYLNDWLIFVPIFDTFTNLKYDKIEIYDNQLLLVNRKFIY